MHTADRGEDNIHEGYETWLLQEAKRRNWPQAVPSLRAHQFSTERSKIHTVILVAIIEHAQMNIST